jgi:hypothetical protein
MNEPNISKKAIKLAMEIDNVIDKHTLIEIMTAFALSISNVLQIAKLQANLNPYEQYGFFVMALGDVISASNEDPSFFGSVDKKNKQEEQ